MIEELIVENISYDNLVGDIDFLPDDRAVLHVVLPMKTVRALCSGGAKRYISLQHNEVMGLLARIFENPVTSKEYRVAVRSLLKIALESPNSSDPERQFIKSKLNGDKV